MAEYWDFHRGMLHLVRKGTKGKLSFCFHCNHHILIITVSKKKLKELEKYFGGKLY